MKYSSFALFFLASTSTASYGTADGTSTGATTTSKTSTTGTARVLVGGHGQHLAHRGLTSLSMKIKSASSSEDFTRSLYAATSEGGGNGGRARRVTFDETTSNNSINFQKNTLQASSTTPLTTSFLRGNNNGGTNDNSVPASSGTTVNLDVETKVTLKDKLNVAGNLASSNVLNFDNHHHRHHRRQLQFGSASTTCDEEMDLESAERNEPVCEFSETNLLLSCTSDVDDSTLFVFEDTCRSNGFDILDFGDITVSCKALYSGVGITYQHTLLDQKVCSSSPACSSASGICQTLPMDLSDAFQQILASDPDFSNVFCQPTGAGVSDGCDINVGTDTSLTPGPTTVAPVPTPSPTMTDTIFGTDGNGEPCTPSFGFDFFGDCDDGDDNGPTPVLAPTWIPTASSCVNTKIEICTDLTAEDEWNLLIDNVNKTVIVSESDYGDNGCYSFEDCLVEKCLTYMHFDEGQDGGDWNVTITYGDDVVFADGNNAPFGFNYEFGADCSDFTPPSDTRTGSNFTVDLLTGLTGASSISYAIFDNEDTTAQYSSFVGSGKDLDDDKLYTLTTTAFGCATVILAGITAVNFVGAIFVYDNDEFVLPAPDIPGEFSIVVEVGSQCEHYTAF